jgi:hypothetical protein
LRLTAESALELRIISQVGSEPLQRDQALVISVERSEHLAHATAAEEGL